jgi:5-enolpyruvylshikimate-3-phosphate synthase
MAFIIAGLFAHQEGETVMHHTDCINTSYPGFAGHLDAVIQGKAIL